MKSLRKDLDENKYDEVNEIMCNSQLNTYFLNLARELDIMEPKTPEDVYKSHLENVRPGWYHAIVFTKLLWLGI